MAENRRTSTRHEVDLAIRLTRAGGASEHRTINLSLGGALVRMARVPMGERVTVRFTVPTQDEAIEAAATVRWSTDDSVGVQFDGLRAKDVWALNKYFEQLSG